MVEPNKLTKDEKITIAKHGIPAAILLPSEEQRLKLSHAEIVAGMRALRQRVLRGKPSIRELIQEGRRF